MIGCLRTCVRKQPIIALYFESEYKLSRPQRNEDKHRNDKIKTPLRISLVYHIPF